MVKTDQKNRGTWPLAIVSETFPGSDGVIRGVKLKTANGHLERPVQHLYPLELHCEIDREPTTKEPHLDPEAQVFRPRRDAAVAANLRMKQVEEEGEW